MGSGPLPYSSLAPLAIPAITSGWFHFPDAVSVKSPLTPLGDGSKLGHWKLPIGNVVGLA